ncbi:hypothetical protein [cf. Phormidesmis sp. LEGE 11477]|uniref:hypothetical protein n=1 Tax=cf. Phormidesmis sp. LEGE 11477 TaxID=1828680 RepID=UPI0018807FA2|nr:hypothetical protein [cf. Phormidesmis sp. LEGE 11477]MBE9063281.1 hypothetical protein [cf. Phormidesmis sp. LEGE 11477]
MKKTDMELQVIREKLNSLQAEPARSDVAMSPWADPQVGKVPAEKFRSQQAVRDRRPQKAKDTPPAIAIKTLKQRAGNSPYGTVHTSLDRATCSEADDLAVNDLTASDSIASKSIASTPSANTLIDRELPQIASLVHSINERSQQQAHDLLSLKRSAQKAAFALHRKGIHTHPQLDAIDQFIEQSSTASIPNIEIDSYGKLCLTQSTVRLGHAEAEAIVNATYVRQQTSSKRPFLHPDTVNLDSSECLQQSQSDHSGIGDSQQTNPRRRSKRGPNQGSAFRLALRHAKRSAALCRQMLVRIKGTISRQQAKSRLKDKAQRSVLHKARTAQIQPVFVQPVVEGKVTEGGAVESAATLSDRSSFSWIDATIWIVSATIIRILLNNLVFNYPFFQIPLMLILVSIISYSIYRIVLSQSMDMNATYRTGAALLGLVLGSVL